MSDPDALRLAGWHLALFLGSDSEWEMCDGTPVKLGHLPAILESRAFALERARSLRADDLVHISDLRKRLGVAASERTAVARMLATTLARCDALHRQLADERTVHHATASAGQVEMLHAELSVAPRLALVRAGDLLAESVTDPEALAAWESARGVECDE